MPRTISLSPLDLPPRRGLAAAALLACVLHAQAAEPAPATATAATATPTATPANAQVLGQQPHALAQAFAAAWARQPEAVSADAQRAAAQARREAARAWTPEPAAVEISARSDRLLKNEGAAELEVGLALPLWLPGERARAADLAEAEAGALEPRTAAARLRLAGELREAWWALQRARAEVASATERLQAHRALLEDVKRRVDAGELAPVDLTQAEAAAAAAEAERAPLQAERQAARLRLQGLGGLAPATLDGDEPALEAEAAAAPAPDAAAAAAHPALREIRARLAQAEASFALAERQTRAAPELRLAATRDRGAYGEAYGQSLTVGLRVPLGEGARRDARLATARAEAEEARATLGLETARLDGERAAAQARLDGTLGRIAAAERRAGHAERSRSAFDLAFRNGDADLPTRLRVEAEAVEARRALASARLEAAAAQSALLQAQGRLPQ